MTAGLATEGLSLEQAPPLSVPASFFLVAPVALVGAGALLAYGGAELMWTRYGASTLAMLHLGTLGFLAAVMLGALYQMIPVVAGAPVPGVRLAHAVHALLVLGALSLVAGLFSSSRSATVLGASTLGVALGLFLVPVAVALARAPTKNATVTGMRLAVAGLAALVLLGVAMGLSRGSGAAAPRYPGWVTAHLAIGFIVWVGGLISAVSFQVVPMFYLAPAWPRWAERAIPALVGVTLAALLAAIAVDAGPRWMAAAAAPGALSVWLLHPLITLRGIRRRKRRRADPSVLFWQAGLVLALGLLPVGACAALADDSRWPVLFGWLVVWGWAGLIVHGMLTRIVPFLVWFHRFSPLVGSVPVPPMKKLWPARYATAGLALHLTTVLLGAIAIGTGSALVARSAGAGLVLTGVTLGAALLRVLSAPVPR